MIINQVDGTFAQKHLRSTFYSLSEFADYCAPLIPAFTSYGHPGSSWQFGEKGHKPSDAIDMARMGWETPMDDALTMVDDITTQMLESTTEVFTPVWDVQGGSVDIGQFLSGEPECMIDYPPTQTIKDSRVVTMCVSISTSGAIGPESMIERGAAIAALAQIVASRGFNLELWADWTTGPCDGKTAHYRILVKSANDTIDLAKIMYAVANPSMLRVLGFTAMHGMPRDWQRALEVGCGYGSVCDPDHDLPEGTIYMNSSFGWEDYDAKGEMLTALKALGIIE